jgi:hypothetical protein
MTLSFARNANLAVTIIFYSQLNGKWGIECCVRATSTAHLVLPRRWPCLFVDMFINDTVHVVFFVKADRLKNILFSGFLVCQVLHNQHLFDAIGRRRNALFFGGGSHNWNSSLRWPCLPFTCSAVHRFLLEKIL